MSISTLFPLALTPLLITLVVGCATGDSDRSLDTSEVVGQRSDDPADMAADITAVRALLDEQVRLWNVGDVDGFMEYYWRSDSLRFASRGEVRYGWQASLDSYKERYPDRAAMGHLVFEDLDIRALSSDWIVGFGRFRLTRSEELGDLTGLFTLLLRRMDDGWRIVHDHTSD